MYLHVGQDEVVRQQDIVGIFDMDNTTISRSTREYLTKAEKSGRVDYATEELPRSFVVCSRIRRQTDTSAPRDKVYISKLSPNTLYKRTRRMKELSNV